MNKSKVLTIHDLYEACQKEIKEGKGDRHILISSDEEGNWYHELYFRFRFEIRYVSSFLPIVPTILFVPCRI